MCPFARRAGAACLRQRVTPPEPVCWLPGGEPAWGNAQRLPRNGVPATVFTQPLRRREHRPEHRSSRIAHRHVCGHAGCPQVDLRRVSLSGNGRPSSRCAPPQPRTVQGAAWDGSITDRVYFFTLSTFYAESRNLHVCTKPFLSHPRQKAARVNPGLSRLWRSFRGHQLSGPVPPGLRFVI